MRGRPDVALLAAVALATAGAARAAAPILGTTAPALRAQLTFDGKSYEASAALARPQAPAPGAAMLLETATGDDLSSLALSRGMSVARIDLSSVPAGARAEALRILVPRLRQTTGARRVLAHGGAESADPLLAAGRLFDGLLLHRRSPVPAPLDEKGPRVIETFGSDAYWRAGPASVAAEAREGANRRRFFLAGAAEAAGPTTNCAAPVNIRSVAPALRALLVVLDDWTRGINPPASRAPSAADLTAAKTLAWPKIPGLPAPPAGDRQVPKIDADGNETAGLRLPDQALPVATFTGFNVEMDGKGPPCASGAAPPFPPTKAVREKTGDPRPSLVERYGSRAYFVATMRVVADKLVKERLLLKIDADAYVAAAKQAPF